MTVPIEIGKVTVDVPKLKELAKLVTSMTTVDGGAGTFTTKRKVALGLGAAGTALLVTGIFVGRSAHNKESDAFELCPDPQSPCMDAARADELVRSGHKLSIGADVMFGIAGTAAIVAGVLWFTGAPVTSRQIAVAPTARGMTLLGRF